MCPGDCFALSAALFLTILFENNIKLEIKMIYLISIQKIIILILSKLPHKQDAFFSYLSQCGGYKTTVIKCPKTYVFSTLHI